jgi:hypothetical protein
MKAPNQFRDSAVDAIEYRELTEYERKLVDRLLSEGFAGRDEISSQVRSSRVRQIDKEGSLEFLVSGGPMVTSGFRIPVEGWFEDTDGMLVHVLLHVVSGRINELEIYKDDGSQIVQMAEPSRLTIFRPE